MDTKISLFILKDDGSIVGSNPLRINNRRKSLLFFKLIFLNLRYKEKRKTRSQRQFPVIKSILLRIMQIERVRIGGKLDSTW